MRDSKEIPTVFIGWDSRESIGSDVAAHSIITRTKKTPSITYLKHRDLRRKGDFKRPWLVDAKTGNWLDLIDGKQFSTEFSHTRFLVPHLMKYRGWALFFDADMIFLSDIKKLFDLIDDRYAVMCVKHNHFPNASIEKMDGREQSRYARKNWSSFVLWNCSHSANRGVTKEFVNMADGADLHSFSWLSDDLIGALPYTYNYIQGVSPPLQIGQSADVIHYTEGGPWFDECKDVPFSDLWISEYEDFMSNGHDVISSIPSVVYEK